MKLVQVEDTRKQLAFANASRCAANVQIMKDVLELRLQAAHLLKYSNHAQFRLEIKMAKTESAVMEFLTGLRVRLQSLAEQELQELLELKKSEKDAKGLPFDGKINAWDFQVFVSAPILHAISASFNKSTKKKNNDKKKEHLSSFSDLAFYSLPYSYPPF